ncbi:MAG: hypothetical protein HFI49_01575 [Bacilli bacterium]|jgi:hypothetical protein|nr:hypothetical protein [Bacilli bacterium]
MNFLDKLYESNYFGIGLFAVISFLVVTFLIVLFFGKRDEKRRLESTKELQKKDVENTFKETSEPVSLETPVSEIPVMTDNVMPVMPNVEESINLNSTISSNIVEPVVPIINETPSAAVNYKDEILSPVAPINYDYEEYERKQFVEIPKEEIKPIETPVVPVINEVSTPIITEPLRSVEPIRLEPTTYDIPSEPKVIEPIRITIPEEPIKAPIIEEVKPIVPEIVPTVEPNVINETYYKPIEKPEAEEIEVPSIDFDALAKSISDELDELENTTNNYHEEVKVTPIEEVVSKPATQFSSVYVNEPVKSVVNNNVDLPKKIDLPTMKSSEIEPENYNI